ncbi:LptF/LptG family permease [Shimia sp. W99]
MNWRAHTGLAVRAMVRAYLLAIGFVLFTLLIIALTIDLTDTLEQVRTRADDTDTPLWRLLFPYAGYRAVDIITRLLGMAALIGAGVATVLRHQRMEDVVLSAAGSGPSLTLGALLITGLLTGAVQGTFQTWLRPWAVQQQVALQLGSYGERFAETHLSHRWFVDGGRALRAEVTRGAEPGLRDLHLFEGIDQPALTRVLTAETAEPTARDGIWVLQGVTLWDRAAGIGNATTVLDEMELAFPLNQERVKWYGVGAHYVPVSALNQVARLKGTGAADDAATELAIRYTAFFLPGVFALLGMSLAMAARQVRRLAPFRLLLVATLGYVTLVSVKVFWALGSFGRLPPYPAALGPMVVAVLLAVLLQLRQAGYLQIQRR